ncbi:MAG: S6e family ribosomal protein [Nitrososphaeria archaeon]
MANYKVVLSDPRSGKSTVYEVKDRQAAAFIGLKINDVVSGTILGVEEDIRITGGSDRAGFPMRPDIPGGVKKYALLTKGVGLKDVGPGERRRKLVRGNTITEDIYQINAVLIPKGELKVEESKKS